LLTLPHFLAVNSAVTAVKRVYDLTARAYAFISINSLRRGHTFALGERR